MGRGGGMVLVVGRGYGDGPTVGGIGKAVSSGNISIKHSMHVNKPRIHFVV